LKANINNKFCRIHYHYDEAKAREIPSTEQILTGYSRDVLSSLDRSTSKYTMVQLGKNFVEISFIYIKINHLFFKSVIKISGCYMICLYA
jgi:hypothetical protein